MADFQPFLSNARVARLLRTAAFAFRKRPQNLILVAPTFDLPPDLQADVTLLDYPLPSLEELQQMVTLKAEQMPDLGIAVDLNGDILDVARALAGLTYRKAEEAIRKAIVTNGAFDDGAIGVILAEKARVIRMTGALQYFHQQAGWDDIGGLDLLKSYAARAIRSGEPAAQAFGVDRRRGTLLVGLPGCGKSLTAKALAGGRMPLLRLDVGALFGGLVGQSESQTRQALRVVEAVGRCILWIDEIEKGLASGGEMDGGTSLRVLGTILTWMEESTAPCYIVATANDIGALRPELVRRFDATFFIDLPDPNARIEIARIHLAKRDRDPDQFDLSAFATATDRFTGAEIEQAIIEAIAAAYEVGGTPITTDDLVREARQIVPLMTTMRPQMEAMRTWAKAARAASSTQDVGQKPLSTMELMEL